MKHLSRSAGLTLIGLVLISSLSPAQTTEPTTGAATQPTAQATTQPTLRDIQANLIRTQTQVQKVMSSPTVLTNATERAAAAPQAIPLLKETIDDFRQAEAVRPALKSRLDAAIQNYEANLLAFGDTETADRIHAEIAARDANSAAASAVDLEARWLVAGNDADAQAKLVDEVTALDTSNPTSDALASLTMRMHSSAANDALSTRLQNLVVHTLTSPIAVQMSKMLVRQASDAAKLASLTGKPLLISGKTVDGKNFTSTAWAGKVVLVDFWATWCAPCRAELPRVKKIYDQYHAQGLEILGVSNDYDADALTKFVAKDEMPWPQLFDAAAAARHDWNSITQAQGIDGIPTMFLIDKQGICRTVEARANMEEMIPKLLAE